MLFAAFVYAWRILSAPIAAEFTGWTSVQLAVTFTVCMAFFCLGGLAGGVLLNCAAPAFNVRLSAVLFLAGFLMAAVLAACSFLIRLPGAEAEISGKPGFTAGAEFSTGKMLRQPGFWCFFLWAAPLSALYDSSSSYASTFVFLIVCILTALAALLGVRRPAKNMETTVKERNFE